MGIAALRAVASGGGRVSAPQPTMAYAGTGQFTITNYNPDFVYTLTPSAGTASRSGATVTLSNASADCTVVAKSVRGVNSAARTVKRRPFTYHNEYQCWEVTYSGSNLKSPTDPTNPTPGVWSWDCPGGSAGGGAWGVNVCKRTDCGNVSVKDGAPSGFSDSGSEWFQVV